LPPIAVWRYAKKAAHAAVREVVARAVADPRVALKALGEPKQGELIKLYQSQSPVWYAKIPSGSHLTEMLALICSAFPR
jgi:hypothetical protein